MALGADKTTRDRKPARVRVWPARALMGTWVALLCAMLVADPSWTPAGLLAATVVVAVGSGVLGGLSGARLSAAVQAPGRAAKGQAAACELTVRNGSALPVLRAYAHVNVENPLTAQRALLQLPLAVGPYGQARVPFEVESQHCGMLSVSCKRAEVLDVLGIVRRMRSANVPMGTGPTDTNVPMGTGPADTSHETARIAVPPAALAFGAGRAGVRAHDVESFTYAPDRPGDDPAETFAVREYEPGDSVRRIHWKLSGKLGRTMLRESSFPIYSTLALLVETGWDEPGPDAAAADAQMEAVAALMASLLDLEVAFELAFVDRATGGVAVRRVADQTAMWDAVGALLVARRTTDPEGSVRAFLEHETDTVWAHVVYLTAGAVGADAGMLAADGGAVTVLRCMPGAGEGERAGEGAAEGVPESAPAPASAGALGEPLPMDGYVEVRYAPASWQHDLQGVQL